MLCIFSFVVWVNIVSLFRKQIIYLICSLINDYTMIKTLFVRIFFFLYCMTVAIPAFPCTGITFNAKDGSHVVARTIEWGGSFLNSCYVVVPRGYTQQSYIPGGSTDGMVFTSRYGYVGFAVEQKEFVAEGLNEAGLSAGLFYFPNYGEYEAYDPGQKSSTISDLQLVSWVLGNFGSVEEVKSGIGSVRIVGLDSAASTVHWRFADATGKQIVLEIIDGKLCFYDNELGVLTNSPGFDWQITNLNNYVNLFPGSAPADKLGEISLAPFGAGSGFLGLPGDVTPPSRFVRAAFYQTSVSRPDNALGAVLASFQILNNFDIPTGIEFSRNQTPTQMPSATQWTSATDMTNRMIYYRTMYNSSIRCIKLESINFSRTKFIVKPLDSVRQQPIFYIDIK